MVASFRLEASIFETLFQRLAGDVQQFENTDCLAETRQTAIKALHSFASHTSDKLSLSRFDIISRQVGIRFLTW
jgi:hypothetical protein